mmetsp:Transcript_37333/g.98435  ORF Transcript_37333/g.98435 Transcript_37333/m.98435 type:complete len:195 (-) Transcript_37333:47-631(-)
MMPASCIRIFCICAALVVGAAEVDPQQCEDGCEDGSALIQKGSGTRKDGVGSLQPLDTRHSPDRDIALCNETISAFRDQIEATFTNLSATLDIFSDDAIILANFTEPLFGKAGAKTLFSDFAVALAGTTGDSVLLRDVGSTEAGLYGRLYIRVPGAVIHYNFLKFKIVDWKCLINFYACAFSNANDVGGQPFSP